MGVENSADIQQLIEQTVQQDGLEIFGLTVVPRRNGPEIDVIVDFSRGGVTIGMCSGLNKKIRRALESAFFPDGNFSVQVSSPGLDWPMTNTRDFVRGIGRKVAVYLTEKVDEKIQYDGVIDSADDACIVLLTEKYGAKKIMIAQINKAVEIIE